MPHRSRPTPVFIDLTGRRWRRIQRVALAVGVLSTVIAGSLVGTVILSPPIPPELPLARANNTPIAAATGEKHSAFTRVDRLRVAYRRKLASAMLRYRAPQSRHPESVPVLDVGRGGRPTRTNAIVAGFYVNWEDNSFTSLSRNYDKLDWVVAEWAFVAPTADSLLLRVKPQVIELLSNKPPETRPSLFIMLSNFVVSGTDSAHGGFDSTLVRRFLANPRARTAAIRQLTAVVQQYGMAGTLLDMEGFAPPVQTHVLAFARELHDAMHAMGKLSTQAIQVQDEDDYVRR
ncbi:MAG: hypothetical protein H0W68_07605, partial [Gemmatimonadaceae bacterium]|nr:hypothetical protein [Gemmatimonadaceae bacterium]